MSWPATCITMNVADSPVATAAAAEWMRATKSASSTASVLCFRLRAAISVTAIPTTSRSTVVSASGWLVMVKRSYGLVRKKSNQTALEAAAIHPAGRWPLAATATTTTTRRRAASVLGMLGRKGTRRAETATGNARPAKTTIRSWCRRRNNPITAVIPLVSVIRQRPLAARRSPPPRLGVKDAGLRLGLRGGVGGDAIAGPYDHAGDEKKSDGRPHQDNITHGADLVAGAGMASRYASSANPVDLTRSHQVRRRERRSGVKCVGAVDLG